MLVGELSIAYNFVMEIGMGEETKAPGKTHSRWQ